MQLWIKRLITILVNKSKYVAIIGIQYKYNGIKGK